MVWCFGRRQVDFQLSLKTFRLSSKRLLHFSVHYLQLRSVQDNCASLWLVWEHTRRFLFTTANEHVARWIMSSHWTKQHWYGWGQLSDKTNRVWYANLVWNFPGKSEFRGRALERVNRIPSFIRPFPEAISRRQKRELRYFLIRCICLNADF